MLPRDNEDRNMKDLTVNVDTSTMSASSSSRAAAVSSQTSTPTISSLASTPVGGTPNSSLKMFGKKISPYLGITSPQNLIVFVIHADNYRNSVSDAHILGYGVSSLVMPVVGITARQTLADHLLNQINQTNAISVNLFTEFNIGYTGVTVDTTPALKELLKQRVTQDGRRLEGVSVLKEYNDIITNNNVLTQNQRIIAANIEKSADEQVALLNLTAEQVSFFRVPVKIFLRGGGGGSSAEILATKKVDPELVLNSREQALALSYCKINDLFFLKGLEGMRSSLIGTPSVSAGSAAPLSPSWASASPPMHRRATFPTQSAGLLHSPLSVSSLGSPTSAAARMASLVANSIFPLGSPLLIEDRDSPEASAPVQPVRLGDLYIGPNVHGHGLTAEAAKTPQISATSPQQLLSNGGFRLFEHQSGHQLRIKLEALHQQRENLDNEIDEANSHTPLASNG